MTTRPPLRHTHRRRRRAPPAAARKSTTVLMAPRRGAPAPHVPGTQPVQRGAPADDDCAVVAKARPGGRGTGGGTAGGGRGGGGTRCSARRTASRSISASSASSSRPSLPRSLRQPPSHTPPSPASMSGVPRHRPGRRAPPDRGLRRRTLFRGRGQPLQERAGSGGVDLGAAAVGRCSFLQEPRRRRLIGFNKVGCPKGVSKLYSWGRSSSENTAESQMTTGSSG